jgi:hypothetical protein
MCKFILRLALALMVVVLGSGLSSGVPRYSMKFNKPCNQCHVNPNGHGARNMFGAQFYAYNELAMTKPEDPSKINPMISDQIQIGMDSRAMFYGSYYPDGGTGANSFMQMQGELYLIYTLSPSWLFYLDKGLGGGPSGAAAFQVFGMGKILPLNGYVKAGHFTPPYGMHLADHKAFVRERLGFGTYWFESGVEVGIQPGDFLVAVAGTNGASGFQDNNEGKAVTAHAEYRRSFSDFHLWYGVSGRFNYLGKDLEDRLGGAYGGLAYGNLAFMGEIDYRDQKVGAAQTKSLVSFAELSYLAMRGLTLKVEHDFQDSDLDLQSGVENMYVLGAEVVPTGFLQLIPNLRFHDRSQGTNQDYLELELQLHLFY